MRAQMKVFISDLIVSPWMYLLEWIVINLWFTSLCKERYVWFVTVSTGFIGFYLDFVRERTTDNI